MRITSTCCWSTQMGIEKSFNSWRLAIYVATLTVCINVSSVSGVDQFATTGDINLFIDHSLYFEVVEPEELAYTYRVKPAKDFGEPFSRIFFNVKLVPAEPYAGCSPYSNEHLMYGAVALVERGDCSFVSKTYHAERAGAVAIIITDNNISNDEAYVEMIQDETERTVHIPALYSLGKDGHMIRSLLKNYDLDYAIIHIPVNVTGIPTYRVNHPPWTLW